MPRVSPKYAPIWLAAGSGIWSALVAWIVLLPDDYFGLFGDLGAIVILFGIGVGVFLLLQAIQLSRQRQRLGPLVAVNLLIGPLLAGALPHERIRRSQWQLVRPSYEADVLPLLSSSFWSHLPRPARGSSQDWDIHLASSNTRVVRDRQGRRFISFVRYRVGLDNGVAYVYAPDDAPKPEFLLHNGKPEHTNSGLGRALSGFGELAGVEPLGEHWYRCLFT